MRAPSAARKERSSFAAHCGSQISTARMFSTPPSAPRSKRRWAGSPCSTLRPNVASSTTRRGPKSPVARSTRSPSTSRSYAMVGAGDPTTENPVGIASSSIHGESVRKAIRIPDPSVTMKSMKRSGICGRVHAGRRRGEIPSSVRSRSSAPTISTGPSVNATSMPLPLRLLAAPYGPGKSRAVHRWTWDDAAMPADTYSHGHHESVLRSPRWRTAENSAGYLLPHLRAGQSLLDVGCGPGNITVDLAARVAPGTVVGIDAATDAIAAATEANTTPEQVTFAVGDVYALDAPDATYDVVHAHQVLQHLSDPVAALREMRRVTRPGGLVAARDSDYASFAWAPDSPLLVRWLELYFQITTRNDAEANAGRYLLGWAQQAGFTDVTCSTSTWTFADAESRALWGGLWADRVVQSSFAEQAVEYGYADAADLAALSDAWRAWAEAPDAWFAVLHGEILARA